MKLNKNPYKGCRDFFPEQMRIRDYLFNKMKQTAESFSFEAYDGPLLEEVELYKAKSGEELINEQIYSFYDRGERHVAIRPEMTPTLARMVASSHRQRAKPLRWYSIPNLMRYERPQKGRLREHWQLNVDIFGAEGNWGEIEIVLFIKNLMESFGAKDEMYSILVNDRKIVDSVFQDLLKTNPETSYKLYKLVDQFKKLPPDVFQEKLNLLSLSPEQSAIFSNYMNLNSLESLQDFAKKYHLNFDSFFLLIQTLKNDFQVKNIIFDTSIVRGLDYYTGLVFEVFDNHPDNRRAIAGGGAYANLLQIFGEEPLLGIGLGMGDVTLTDFLATHQLLPDLQQAEIDLLLVSLSHDALILNTRVAQFLRKYHLKVDVHPHILKSNKIFKISDKKQNRFLGVIGEEELKVNKINLRNEKTKENFELSLDFLFSKESTEQSMTDLLNHLGHKGI